MKGARRILVVYYNHEPPAVTRLTLTQNVRALDASECGHDVIYYNAFEDCPTPDARAEPLPRPSWARRGEFDAAVLHYSFLAFHWNELALFKWKRLFRWIGELECPKLAMPQDEYDRAGLLDEWLYEWGVSILFTVFDGTRIGPLYPTCRRTARLFWCLPGYIDEPTARAVESRLRPHRKRRCDVAYRARHLPFWFGRASQFKHSVADAVAPRAAAHGLKTDISTRDGDTIPGAKWLDFLADGRGVIGCEGGVSAVDWRGETEARARLILKGNPLISFDEFSRRMPAGWDDYGFLSVSPRHFEAVITRTCQVLVEGEYSGVLEADKHYIPLRRDFSNVDEALEKLGDERLVNDMVERAYHDIYRSGRYSYGAFARQIEDALFFDGGGGDAQPVKLGATEGEAGMDEAVASLERQLIAERHHRALLETQLLEARQHIGALTSQLQTKREGRPSVLNALRSALRRFRRGG